ncbi:MAG: sugar phosphate isomerase/epimerase family protein [Candidatus Acidiferrales bacterium]
MERVLSTYRYAKQPLSAPLLNDIAQAEFRQIAIYCAPVHFEYGSQPAVKSAAGLLAEHGIGVFALHSPVERDFAPGRESGVPISICDLERIRRIDAMDEVKRALEVAEQIPFRYLVQHFGSGRQTADPRRMDAGFSSLEHLTVFAKARGVTIALENTTDEVGAPASLVQFVKETHLHDLKFCFDAGHAHIEGGVGPAFEILRERAAMAELHDNHGERDEHLMPWEGTIDWDETLDGLAATAEALPIVLEVKEQPGGRPPLDEMRKMFDRIEKEIEARRKRNAKS